MAINRRKFLQSGALATAALTAPHPLRRAMFGASLAHAAPADAILVLVQLEGGNDGLNTVIPMDDAPGFAQRSLYESARPNLKIPFADLLDTEIDPDPLKGNRLALHPQLSGLKSLYDAGRVAVLNGIGYPGQSLSHFRSEDIWFGGTNTGTFSTGWMGRYLASEFAPTELVAVDVNETLNPMFSCPGCNVLAVSDLDDFVLPDDPLFPDATAKKLALSTAYGIEADDLVTDGIQLVIGGSGNVMLDKLTVYDDVDTNWSSNLNGKNFSLARRLKEVASIIRHDNAASPTGPPTGARFFHVRIGGFDTHSNQGTIDPSDRQPGLLDKVSRALTAFYDDMVDLGVSNKVVVLTLSEFGRRVAENGGAGNAGTDHGASSVLFALGGPVVGGVYGTLPKLNDLDKGNLKFHTDFRQVYATLIDKWLGNPGDHVPLLPGGPFTTLGFL